MFIFLSLLCISIVASKLQVIRCRCLTHRANQLALLIIIIVMIACTSLLNLVSVNYTSVMTSVTSFSCIHFVLCGSFEATERLEQIFKLGI